MAHTAGLRELCLMLQDVGCDVHAGSWWTVPTTGWSRMSECVRWRPVRRWHGVQSTRTHWETANRWLCRPALLEAPRRFTSEDSGIVDRYAPPSRCCDAISRTTSVYV